MKIAYFKNDFYHLGYGLNVIKYYSDKGYLISDDKMLEDEQIKKNISKYTENYDINAKKYKGQGLDNKTIFVSRCGGFGDVLFVLSALKYIKDNYNCKIYFNFSPAYLTAFENNNCFDRYIEYPIESEVLEQCDYHFFLDNNTIGTEENKGKNYYDIFAEKFYITLPDSYKRPFLVSNNRYSHKIKDYIKNNKLENKIKIGYQLFSASNVRNIPLSVAKDMLKEIIALNKNIVILLLDSVYSQNRFDYKDFIKLDRKHPSYCYIGLPTIPNRIYPLFLNLYNHGEMVSAINECDYFIGNDSCMVHVAEALQKRGLGIFGPFKSENIMKHYIFTQGYDINYPCAPCNDHSKGPCKNATSAGHGNCYYNIDIEKIKSMIKEGVNLLKE